MAEGSSESFTPMADKVDNADYTKIPLRAINVPCRRRLSNCLLPERRFSTLAGINRDWKGLCELAGFDDDLIQFFENKSDPVSKMLEHLAVKQFTIAKLINMLETIERFDVIEDIRPLIENDVNDFIMKQKNDKQNLRTIQRDDKSKLLKKVPKISKSSIKPKKCYQRVASYDAYVAYSESDLDFVTELVEKLEKTYHLRLFIKNRDMSPEAVEVEEDLHLINERCKKILIIVSEESLSDQYCEFQAILAQTTAVECSLTDRKVIPIVCKPCVFPSRFKHLAKLDYTKADFFGKFWDRLYYSITDEIYIPFDPTAIMPLSEKPS